MIKKLMLASVVFAYTANAQQIDLDTLRIEGRNLPSAIHKVDENFVIISKAEIAKSAVQSVDELLAMYSGIDVTRRGIMGVQSDISVRGGSFEQVLLLINGVRMNDAQTAHNQFNIPLNLNDVDRVEIIKGPAARRYGANAFSGAINIITKTKADSKLKLNLMGGSYGTFGAGVSGDLGKTKLKHKVHANYMQSDGYRYNTDFDQKNLWYQNSYALPKGEITMQAGFGEKKFGANGFYASPQAIEQYEEIQSSLVSAKYEQKGDKFDWKTQLFWKRSQDLYLYKRQDPSFYRNMHIGNNIGGEIVANYTSAYGVTGIGVEIREENLESSNLGKQNRNVTTAFLDHNFNLFNNKLNITPGISWSYISQQGNFFFPGLEIGFDIDKTNKVYAHAAKVHRVPSFTELYYVSRTEQGNPNLKPESAIMYELGYRYQKPSTIAKLSLFYRSSDNLIDWNKANEEDLWTPHNIGNVDTKGFELNFKQKFNGFIKSLSADYTYLDQDLGDSNVISRYAFNGLRHQFIAKMENKIAQSWSSQLAFRFLDRVTLDNYNLVDFKLNYTKTQWNAFVQVNNVFNTAYQEANLVPMPGRWFAAGASYTIQ